MRKSIERRGRKMYMERFILQTLATCGIVAAAVVAPNAVGVLKRLDREWESKIDPRKRIDQALYRLKKKGYIASVGRDHDRHLSVTAKGRVLLKKIDDTKFYVRKPLRWDGRWRMVIFDIAETRRNTRDIFRSLLKKVGFVQVQGSVWIHPYDCEDVVKLIKTNQHLGGQVVYAIIDVMENDARFRRHFGLRAQ